MVQKNQLNTKSIWLVSAVVVAIMLGFSAWAWQQVPAGASLPVHWNMAGEPDRYGGKFEGLLLLPLVAAGVAGIFTAIRYIDPLRANIERSGQAYRASLLGVLFVLLVIHIGAVLSALGYPINIGLIASPAIGIMFIVLGNYLGKIRRNYMFGVRTPWTLSSELAWNKTHRITGKLFVAAGFLILVACLWGPIVAFYTMMISLLGTVAFAVIYSYLIWKQDPAMHTAPEAK